MSRRGLVLAALVLAAVFFALGLGAARWAALSAPEPPRAQPAETAPTRPPSARVLLDLDAGSIQLLPDASLRLDLPRGFDAGDLER